MPNLNGAAPGSPAPVRLTNEGRFASIDTGFGGKRRKGGTNMESVGTNQEIRSGEYLNREVFSDSMLDNLLGPVAFYSLRGERLDVVRYNRKFYEEIKIPNFSDYLQSIQLLVVDEDKPFLYSLFEKAAANPQNGAVGVIRFYRLGGSIVQFRFHLYYVREEPDGSKLYYSTVQDLAQFLTADDYTRLLSQAFFGSVIFLRRRGSAWSFRVVVHGLEDVMGLSTLELQHELNNGRFEQRIDPAAVRQIKTIILGSKTNMEHFSEPFDFAKPDGGTVKLKTRFLRVNDKSSEVDYVLSLRSADE